MLIKGAFAIILNNKNQVLLVLRDDIPMWNLVGGGVEENENFEEALMREAQEEVCVDIKITRQTGYYHNKDSKGNNVEVKCYLCKIQNGEPKLGTEGTHIKFFDLDKLPKNLIPKQRGRVDDYLNSSDLVERIQNEESTTECMNSLSREDFSGLEEWLTHPKVIKQRKEGRLKFDIK